MIYRQSSSPTLTSPFPMKLSRLGDSWKRSPKAATQVYIFGESKEAGSKTFYRGSSIDLELLLGVDSIAIDNVVGQRPTVIQGKDLLWK